MMAGAIFLIMAREFTDEDLKLVFEELELDYGGIDGDKNTKIKSLLTYCINNKVIDELSRACLRIRPDIDWGSVFVSLPPAFLAAGSISQRLKQAAAQYESEHNGKLPVWWTEFQESIDQHLKQISVQAPYNEIDFNVWLAKLPAEQRIVAQNLLEYVRDAIITDAKASTRPVNKKKTRWWNKIVGNLIA